MIEFENLDLRVSQDAAGGYSVEATGPAGERASGPFDRAPLAGLGDAIASIRALQTDRATLERVGTALFDALFARSVLRIYDRVRPEPGGDGGLRLRLHLPPELAHLPWELLCDQSRYLSFDPAFSIVRYLDLPNPPAPLATQPPLRLLHLAASPVDAPPLDVDREAQLLDHAVAGLARQGLLDLLPGQPGTLRTLHAGLLGGCHVLHVSSHGGFAAGKGFLLLEDASGRGEKVEGDTLGHLLQGSQVRLAVLNACDSARAGDGNAFTSVAAALVEAGVPAVVAHQQPMPDESALPFAAEFYRALADGLAVDAAVCEGRKAVLSELGAARWERADWATPVLFMRAPDGRILTLEEDGTAAPGASIVQHTTTVNVTTMQGGVINVGGAVALPANGAVPRNGNGASGQHPPAPPQPRQHLHTLLGELQGKIQTLAPREVRPLAREKVALLEGALAAEQLDLSTLAEVWDWTQAELPPLSGAVFSIVREAMPLAERQGGATLDRYLDLFGAY